MKIIGKLAVLASAGLLLGFGMGIPPARAGTHVSIRVGIAPPPPRWEPIPAPRVGFIWMPGFWRWSGASYIWIGGRWHPRRVGYRYVRPYWHHEHGGWRFTPGSWHHARQQHWRPRPHRAHPYRVRGPSHMHHRGPRGGGRYHSHGHGHPHGHDHGRGHRH